LDFRRECLSHSFSLLVPAFALPMTPAALAGPPSQSYGTLRYRVTLADYTLSFGSWLEPRYIFGAETLI
jgi:hypothetical protein